ncbi:hypothetical protein Vi05172_g636 [Venturia inaequalis]|nr:hypothetical protein Vi05172_g636 [Venturia inaequalis]
MLSSWSMSNVKGSLILSRSYVPTYIRGCSPAAESATNIREAHCP